MFDYRHQIETCGKQWIVPPIEDELGDFMELSCIYNFCSLSYDRLTFEVFLMVRLRSPQSS